jgi:activating signal cointegrator complex subunit 2
LTLQGLLLLDDAQFDYFLALVDGDRELLHQRQQQQRHSSAAGAAAAAGASSSSSSSSQALPADLPARVAAIRELLPDYGDGFLTAALFHSSFDSERVINCLLEGSLPPALQGLDPGLQRWTPPASAAAVNGAPGATAGAGLSWTGLAREAAAAAAPVPREHVPLPSLAAAAAAGPRPAIDRRTGRVLGALGGRVRDATRSIAHEMQYEYDDEYDDSFDDLTGPGNDGVCDIEGEDNSSSSARPARGPARGPAAAGDEYADEPAGGSSSGGGRRLPGGQQQQQQQQRQQRRPETLYVLDGKVYNYKKAGAQEVVGQAGAKAAVKAAQHAALEIHGLGPGGNVPLSVADVSASGDRRQQHQQYQQHQQVPAGGGGSGGSGGRGGRGPGGGRGGGSSQQQQQEDAEDGGGGGRGGGRGRGRGSFTHKEAHKAAIGNHHRKDRAAAKAGRGMF